MTHDDQGRRFGLWTLTFLVVANMIGAGVFTTSGFTIADLKSPHLVIAAWAIGGLIATTGAVSYGQLSRVMPESGGEYLFLSRAAHPMLGFVAGWVSVIAGFSGAIALAAIAFQEYLLPEQLRPQWLPNGSLAVSVIVFAGLTHGVQIRAGALIQNLVVICKLILIAGLIAIAVWYLPSHHWHTEGLVDLSAEYGVAQSSPEGGGRFLAGLTSAFLVSLVWISLSYCGFNAAVYVAGEAKDAERNVPRALLMGTVLVLILYLILNAIFVYAPPAERIAGQEQVAVIAAEALGGSPVAAFVRIVISAALLTSVVSMMMAAPRVYAKMADDGFLPRFFRAGNGAPWGAVIAQTVIAVIIVLVSRLPQLLQYLGLTLSVSAAGSVACLFLPTVRQHPVLHRAHAMPAVYILSTLTAAGFMAVMNPKQAAAAVATFGCGAVAYAVTRLGRSTR